MIRLRHVHTIKSTEAAHEIVLLNSHDGTSSYQILSGMFRFVCANGMVCGEVDNDIRIRHKGNVGDAVIEGAFQVLNSSEKVAGQIDEMRSTTLNHAEQIAFARAAIPLRFGDDAPVQPGDILRARRFDDNGDDAWRTFNRIQENLVRGGMLGRDTNGRTRRVREVTGMDKDTTLNRQLWALRDEMMRIKNG